MKNAQTFCNKMIGLTSLPNQERITAVFNRLICDYYSHERNAIQQLRTIRQTRIRFSLAVGNYEITSRQADYVLKLLKAEEELLLMVIPKGMDRNVAPAGNVAAHWTGTVSELTELIYGLYLVGCFDGGQCDIKEIVRIFEQMFHIKLPHIYNRFIAIRNRKNERAVFLKKLYDALIRKMDELDR